MGHKIIIEALSHEAMRYDTLGDWFRDENGNMVIQTVGADPITDDAAFLVALHELVEAKLCANAGITQAQVDEFDLAFEGEGEPGDSPDAPYREQHRKAMLIEHMMASFLGLTDYGAVA